MGLACKGGEEEVAVFAEVMAGCCDDGVVERARRRASTSSWMGSGWLMLCVKTQFFGPVFCYNTDGAETEVTGNTVLFHTQQR